MVNLAQTKRGQRRELASYLRASSAMCAVLETRVGRFSLNCRLCKEFRHNGAMVTDLTGCFRPPRDVASTQESRRKAGESQPR
jgi:hypothetical protein